MSQPAALRTLTFANYWLGLKDTWMERIHGPATGEMPTPARHASAAAVIGLVVTVPVAVVVAGLAASVFAPGLARLLNLAGPNAVAMGSGILMSACGLGAVVAIPTLLVCRVSRHVRRTCERGYLIQMGVRKRVLPPGLSRKKAS